MKIVRSSAWLLERRKIADSGCWLWTKSLDLGGYGKCGTTNAAREQFFVSAHRLSWETFVGPIPEGMNVLHKCDVRNCINPDHLFLGSQKNNIEDMFRKNRGHIPRGETNGNAKLSESDIRDIRSSTDSHVTVGLRYGVTGEAIAAIRKRRTWRHIA